MTIRSVRILSEAAASALPPTPRTAIFSITDPGHQTPLQPGWARIHRHQFSETAYDARTLEFAPIHQWIAGGAISPLQAIEIRQQIAALAADPEPWDIICQCSTGISRSAAIARFIAERQGPKTNRSPSRHANSTVLALLRNPWCFGGKERHKATIYPHLKRAVLRLWPGRSAQGTGIALRQRVDYHNHIR